MRQLTRPPRRKFLSEICATSPEKAEDFLVSKSGWGDPHKGLQGSELHGCPASDIAGYAACCKL